MAHHPPGFWKRAADPDLTPVAALDQLNPDTLAAYYRLCRRPDLPETLVARMVAAALKDRCRVTQSAKALHLLARHSLHPDHLVNLAGGLSDHEYNDRARRLIPTHPRATNSVLAQLCWHAGARQGTDPRNHSPMRAVLGEHCARTRYGLQLSDIAHERNARGRWISEHEFASLLRNLWLGGEDAREVAARMAPTWAGTPQALASAASAITTVPADSHPTLPGAPY